MDGAGGNDEDEPDELRRPPSRRLTLAPPPWEEVLVEDIANNDSSDSDDSCGKGEYSVTQSKVTMIPLIRMTPAAKVSTLSLIPAHCNRRMMKIGWLIQN
jgi:hypothetical protein